MALEVFKETIDLVLAFQRDETAVNGAASSRAWALFVVLGCCMPLRRRSRVGVL